MTSSRTLRTLALLFTVCSGAMLLNTAQAQSAADNIRPIGQVCLAGQPCVGTTGRGAAAPAPTATATAAPAAATPAPAAPVAAATAAVQTAAAPANDFDAAAAYQASCFACHGSDALGAPQPGDAAAWEERMAKGMDAVMANVINGFNAMPAKGICMTCSDDDLRAIVEYMVAQ